MAKTAVLPVPFEEEEWGFVDLLDPEIEYTPPPEPPGPKLELIVNEGPHTGRGYARPRGVDLRIYDGDPTELLEEDLLDLEEETFTEESEAALGVLVDEEAEDGRLPEARSPRDLQEHREAVAGSPQDALQAYFLEGLPEAELRAAPVKAAAILKVRHELFLLEDKRWVPESMGEFRDASLGTLLAAMPEGEQARLHLSWRAAMRSLSEYFEVEGD